MRNEVIGWKKKMKWDDYENMGNLPSSFSKDSVGFGAFLGSAKNKNNNI